MSLFGGSVLLESENFLAGLEKAAGHQNQPGDYCTGFGKQFAGPADFFTGPVFFYAGSAFSIADVRVFFSGGSSSYQNQPGDYSTGFGEKSAGSANVSTGPVFFCTGSAFFITDVCFFVLAAEAYAKINQVVLTCHSTNCSAAMVKFLAYDSCCHLRQFVHSSMQQYKYISSFTAPYFSAARTLWKRASFH